MKKKIGELTLREVINHCQKQDNPNCFKCLLKECYMYEECAIFRVDFKDLDKEIEVDEENENE